MNTVCKLLWSATQFQIAISGNDSIQCIHPSTSWSDLSPSRTSKETIKRYENLHNWHPHLQSSSWTFFSCIVIGSKGLEIRGTNTLQRIDAKRTRKGQKGVWALYAKLLTLKHKSTNKLHMLRVTRIHKKKKKKSN